MKLLCAVISVVYLFLRVFWATGILHIGKTAENILYILFNYGHVCLSIVIVFLLKKIWQLIQNGAWSGLKKILDITDKYSYDVYLVHHILVLGAYSVYNYIDNIVIGSIVIFLLTCLLALLTNQLSKLIGKRFIGFK